MTLLSSRRFGELLHPLDDLGELRIGEILPFVKCEATLNLAS
jgi:hypothetical protein